MTITQQPGLLTCNQSHDRQQLKDDGYLWQSYQAWNAGRRGPLDTGGDYRLDDDRAYGISPGVWGVIYELGDLYHGGKGCAERAVELGADHLMLDIEECYKGTFPDGGRPAISGVRDGGWLGPVHLTTLGCPDKNPDGGFWDYGFDLASFLETGGGIFPQAYYAEYATSTGRAPSLAAENCVAYYCDQLGIPRQSLNLMIWPDGAVPIETEVGHLKLAGLGCQMSVFLTESTTADAFDQLRVCSLAPPYTPGPTPEPEPEPEPEPPVELIGSQHGAKAVLNRMRILDPGGCNPNFDPDNYDAIPLSQLGAHDKDCRAKLIAWKDHDAG